MKNLNDTYYIKRIREGDTDCFGCLLDRYSRQVFALIVRVTNNKEDAEELTQDVFLKVFNKLDNFKEECAFSTWLYRIAYNTAISSIRVKKNEFPVGNDYDLCVLPTTEEDEFFDSYNREEQLDALERALTKLPPDEHLMILLYYKEEKSVNEIARITNLSESNVKVKLHRIRKKIYSYMTEE